MGFENPFGKISGFWLIFFITLANAASMSWFGYDQGVFSGVLISQDFKDHFPQTLNANISGITSSCFSLGAFFGAITAFTAGDKMGRKKTIILGLICNTIGAILQIGAFQLPQLIIGRVINGFGMGLTSATCPVYQAECSKPSVRGKLVVIGSLSNTAAFMLSNWINYALYFVGGALQWRFPLALQMIFPMIVISVLPFLPESPRWLLLQDRHEEALKVIARLMGKNLPLNNEDVTAEFLSIRSAIHAERKDMMPIIDVLMFRDKTQNMRRLLLSMGTQLMQQFSGVNALGYYLPTLLQKSVGFDQKTSRLLTACNATSYLGAAFLCLLLIDLIGRRKLMLYGSITMGSCYLVSALCLRQKDLDPTQTKSMGAATTSMFFLYYFFYGTSFAKVPWVYNSEINSLGWRTRGAAAATATNWMGSFIVTQFTQVGVNNLGWRFYLIFAIICYSYFPIVFCLYPETSRRTLEDMDEIFIQGPGLIVFRDKALTQRNRPQVFVEAESRRVEDGARSDKVAVVVLDAKARDHFSSHVEAAA